MPDNPVPAVQPVSKTPEQQIREALQTIAKALQDAATLTVTTSVKVMNPDNPAVTAANPETEVAKTVMKIEGDRFTTLPVVAGAADFTVPKEIIEYHQKNLDEAIAYRKEIVAMLIDFVKTRRVS
jgi:hypothetical protein